MSGRQSERAGHTAKHKYTHMGYFPKRGEKQNTKKTRGGARKNTTQNNYRNGRNCMFFVFPDSIQPMEQKYAHPRLLPVNGDIRDARGTERFKGDTNTRKRV